MYAEYPASLEFTKVSVMTTETRICQFAEDDVICDVPAEYRQVAAGEQEGFWCQEHTMTIGIRWAQLYGDAAPKYERLSDGSVHEVRIRRKGDTTT